jgi:hypothetical protein
LGHVLARDDQHDICGHYHEQSIEY